MKTLTFKVGKMHCMGCALGLEADLEKINWIDKASVDFDTATATIECNESEIDLDEIEKVVIESGFSIEGQIE